MNINILIKIVVSNLVSGSIYLLIKVVDNLEIYRTHRNNSVKINVYRNNKVVNKYI